MLIYIYILTKISSYYIYYSQFKPVSGSGLGLAHSRRTKLHRETFLRFGHPRLIFSVRLLATSTKICTIGSSKVSYENLFKANNYNIPKEAKKLQ